jgi:Xaa-Pro aminopeptidase
VALALVPLEGSIRLIVSGTELMIPQAKLLTWVEDVRPFANVPKLVAEWAQGAALASWGAAGMVHRLHGGIAAAAGPLMPLDGTLDPIRRRKSPRELDLMRAACGMLDSGLKALAAAAKDGARTAAIAAERAAIAKGAQDARALVSLRAGGMPLPVDGPENPAFDPLLATLAVRHAGYWAEGSITVSAARRPAQDGADAALAALLGAARAGATLPAGGSHAIGLSLDEGGAAFEAGATYALKAGGDGALASAMVRVGAGGAELLWRS